MKAKELPADALIAYDSQDITDVLEYIGTSALDKAECTVQDVTAVAVIVGNAEYDAVYITTSSRPYSVDAEYILVF